MAEESYFDKISGQIQTGNEPFKWYRNRIKELGTPSVPELLRDGKLSDRPAGRALNMFVYSPKLRNKLPYFDTFPLVLPLKSMDGGFLGLNFHYLPYALRARLLDAAGGDNLSVSAVENNRLTKPCLKRYLFGYTRSKFRKIDDEDNLTAIMLPVQRFKKASAQEVWSDSRKMI
tara:strand:+ start:1987 stop:2508 length:522 start_codon:yes stop_codon:yes gene_type:complete